MRLKDKAGQVLIIISIIISVVFASFSMILYFMSRINSKVTWHDRLASRAIEVCDVGISQLISDIHRHNINLAVLPYTTYYSIVKYPENGDTESVKATLSEVPDINDVDGDGNTAEPETDLEGNNIYQIDSVSWASATSGEKIVRRHVAARISIVNLAKFNLFMVQNDVWANNSTLNSQTPIMLDGPYHTNGDLDLGGVIYFNNKFLPANSPVNNMPGGVMNPAYNTSYTVMCAQQILQRGGYPANVTYTQNNQLGLLSPNIGFSVVPNAQQPRGTWFDGAHGGYQIHLESLDFNKYMSMAQVIIDQDNLPAFTVNGANYSSNNLLIDDGNGTQIIDIDLSYFGSYTGSGTDKDVCGGLNNYRNALNSQYGLIIFAKGPVAVHGKLPNCAGANNNKKVTIITTGTFDIIGDVLNSGDPYLQILDSFSDDPDINAWTVNANNANANLVRDVTPANPPFKSVDPSGPVGSCMKVTMVKTGGVPQVTLKRHFTVVPPPAGINNNKFFVNIKAAANGPVQARLIMRDSFNNIIAQSGLVNLNNTNWNRVVLVNGGGSTVNLSDINTFNANANENLEIVFTGLDFTSRNFYIDELGFAFGKSYPVDPATANPTNDGIALISQDNIFENAHYTSTTDSFKYFAVNGEGSYPFLDLRIDGFEYTALDNTMFTVHTNEWLDMFTCYGAMVTHLGGTVRANSFNNTFDPNMANNVSKAIPVGTVIHSYQQLRDVQ